MKKITKATAAIAATAAVAGIAIPAVVSAWGDSDGGRPSYTIADINDGKLGDTIVFNSISDSVIGDEKNFVGARINDGTAKGKENIWNANEITVKDGQEYYVRIYAHNNNPNGEKAVSKNTRVTFGVPGTTGKELKVTGYINSDNATPNEYWDSVVFKSDRNFHLEYMAGSALLENNGIGANGGVKLSDNIVKTGGVKIGYKSLDGNVPGCYTYANYVTIRVKAVFDNSYTVDKRVRREGDTKWLESVDAKIGETVEYAIQYKNTSANTQENVVVKDVLPANMEYIPGTTVLINANHKDGIKNTNDTIATTGINIGSYTAGSNAIVTFKAKVINKTLACGTTKVVNWGQVGVGSTTLQDSASVFVERTCDTPNPDPTPSEDNPNPSAMPTTGATGIVSGVIGLGSITTAGAAFIASRKKLVK